MKDTPAPTTPEAVAPRPKQSGGPSFSLGSSAVWTERMRATLERGITGGKWYSLMDKVWDEGTLRMAAWAVIRKDGSAGVDGESCAALEQHLGEVVALLSRQLKAGQYQPKPVKRVWIDKLGTKEKRPLGIPTVSSYCTGRSRGLDLRGFDSI